MQSDPKKTPQKPAFTDDYLLYLLAQASAAASDVFHAELRRDGLQVSTWRILASLYPDAQLNVGALARKCLLKQPTLTRALDRMVKADLVRRVHSETDRRGVLVELTSKGRDIAAKGVEKAYRHEKRVLANYSNAEIADLKQKLQHLLNQSPRN